MGSGARSATASTDGDAVGATERFGNETGAAAYRQRTGHDAKRGIAQLGIAQIIRANAALLFDAHVGALGDRLRSAGFSSAVIANADHVQPASSGTTPMLVRPAVSALMGADGIVQGGEVGTALLSRDPLAPFGVRLDPDAVTRAFRAAWKRHSVVLVEGSDLERAGSFATFATSHHASQIRLRALRETDALTARLLASVDPRRDAVLVVAPTSRPGDPSLTVAALRSARTAPGLLQSATTRRAGFVSLPDIAPTILDTIGVAAPSSMEGRPMRVATRGGSASGRRSLLVRANDDGLERDHLVAPVTKFVAWYAIALAGATVLLLGRRSWSRLLLQVGALWIIGFLLATFVVVPFHVSQHGGDSTFWAFTILLAAVFAVLCLQIRRRNPVDPLLLALGVVVVVLVVDNLTHDRLEFNAVFGYSATVGIRLSGNGNSAFAILGASAVVFAGLLAWRVRSSRSTSMAIAVLAIVLLSFTPPYFGQDFGGTIAAAPAFFVMAWLLLGRRIRLRTCIAFGAALVASGLIVGFVDLLRPHDQRTHVGRFFEQVNRQGLSGLTTVLQRKGSENAATLAQGLSIAVIVVVVGVVAILWYRAPHPMQRVVATIAPLRAAAIAFTVLAALGYALNDSGIAIPALMCVIIAASVAHLAPLAERIDPSPPHPPDDAEHRVTASV
jgi:hypothetical protein